MMKALLYCTRRKPYLKKVFDVYTLFNYEPYDILNGTIPCECDYEIEEIKLNEYEYEDFNNSPYFCSDFETETLQEADLCQQSCLTDDELCEYLGLYKEADVYGYAIHISNLDIYADPKEINDCVKGEWIEYSNGPTFFRPEAIEHVPKGMTFVWCKENGDQYVFIPVNPEQLCKILNGECTIIVKKKVLKEML